MDSDFWSWYEYNGGSERCITLIALYDDTLKRDSFFINYAVEVARTIARSLDIKCQIEWGKWGASIITTPGIADEVYESYAERITSHKSWRALCLSTYVFTYEREPTNKEISDLFNK